MSKHNTDLSLNDRFKKMGNLTLRAVTALGVLSSNNKSNVFFTSADITEHLVSTSGLGDWDDKSFFTLCSLVSTSMYQSYHSEKQKDVWRTDKKIPPRNCTRKNVKSSYGYRCGLPVEEKAVNKDDVVSALNACKNPGTCDMLADVRNCNDYKVLLNLQIEIAARLEFIFNDKETAMLSLRDKVATVKRLAKSLDE